jgi:hypothetical protein
MITSAAAFSSFSVRRFFYAIAFELRSNINLNQVMRMLFSDLDHPSLATSLIYAKILIY